jgi:hypothetical protein
MSTRIIRSWVLSAALLLLSACATIPVGSDRYSGANFTAYRTYAWMNTDALVLPAGTRQEISALTVRRIREAVETNLSGKGYRKVDTPTQADFVVAFTVGTLDRLSAESYPLPYRGPWTWEWRGSEVEMHTYLEGNLSIDVFDGANKQPVWHGWATKVVTSADKANPGPVVERAVARILRPFPARH